MSHTFLRLPDGSVPPESPLHEVSVTFENDPSGPDRMYTWVNDSDWEWTDSRGHEHYLHIDGTVPTLRPVTELVPGCGECCGVYEDYSVTRYYECVGCGDSIPSERVGKKLDWWSPETTPMITLERTIRTEGPYDLMGIEPVSWDRFDDSRNLIYRPTWNQWLKLVEENNRVVRSVTEG